MKDLKTDMAQIQRLVGDAFTNTGGLVAMSDGGQMSPERLQRTLEQTMEQFEGAVLELRRLCERYSPNAGGYGGKPLLPAIEVSGCVEKFGYGWLHITLNTLLPHCRYQTPAWLSDTVKRLLDAYEAQGTELPYFKKAMLVIDEHCDIAARQVYDQDNKGWKVISNAIKGRLIPDDDQHTLSVCLLSTQSEENVCHITLLDRADVADFFAMHSGDYSISDFYGGRWGY